MPKKRLTIPAFANEKQEAAWWDRHRGEVESDLRAALDEGRARPLSEMLAQRKAQKVQRPVTIRLPEEDIAAARRIAESKGIGYQTCIKILLHEALRREARRAAK